MAKEKSAITTERAGRLYKLIALVGKKPQTRDNLTRRLDVGVRGFYRDLETLRHLGVHIILEEGKYRLTTTADKALAILPFPDPELTLAEAEQLAKGRTKAHQKLRHKLDAIKTNKKPKRSSRGS